MLGKDENPAKAYRIGNTVIEAGGYALICCTDYGNTAGIEGLSVTMSLGNGDSLYLFDKNGDVADTLALETTSRLIHLGRYPDGGDVTPMSAGEATPAAENVRMDYAGTFSSETFRPYLLAWGRVYELDEYFYEKDGVTYVRREALYALCSERSGNSSLTLWLKKQKSDMPLDTVVAESAAMDGPSLRYVRELDSLILG